MVLRVSSVAPLYIPGGLETYVTREGFSEPTISSIENLLKISSDIVRELLSMGFEKRVSIIRELGKLWTEEKACGKFEELITSLSKATGYSRRNVELDLDFIEKVFDPYSIRVMFEKSLIGGCKSIDEPYQIGDGEFIWNKPMGSVFIIAPGNSVIPTLLPTVVSLVSSNFTILRPSITNYEIIICIFSLLKRLIETGFEDALKLSRALVVTYIGHSSSLMEYLLAKSNISVVNYWGGEPGRSSILNLILRNPYRPKVIINGPLTGLAIIDGKMVNESVAKDLAREMIIYDQQLCSSPTFAIFIGSFEEAKFFAKMVGEELNKLGSGFPIDVGENKLYRFLVNRKILELEGKYVLYSINPGNPWTIAIDLFKGDIKVSKEVDFYSRRRFIEIIVIEDMDKLKLVFNKLLEFLMKVGLDGFQTISTLLKREDMDNVLKMLLDYKIYRCIPLGESLLRTPLEPFDGEFLPRYFTYPLYIRSNRLLNEFKSLM